MNDSEIIKNAVVFGKLTAHGEDGEVQVECHSGENSTDIAHPQEHGFASKAPLDSDAYIVNQGGNRDNGAVLIINGSNPIELSVGDSVQYSTGGATIHCTGGKIELNGSSFEGLVKIQELTDKLNAHIDEYDTHTHLYDKYSVGYIQTQEPVIAGTQFDKSDYENTDVTHG